MMMEQKNEVFANILQSMHMYMRSYFCRIYFFIRVQKPITKFCGTLFAQSFTRIEIDITYACNLKCINCNRSCRQAPSTEQMSVEQIKKFIKESVDNNVKWQQIRIAGGEPALHPDIFEILNLLLEYKKNYSPDACILFVTNGYGKIVNDILSKVPEEIIIENSEKKSVVQQFCPINAAPRDLIWYRLADYSMGCQNISVCGIGLTPFGYYPCAIAGNIDRIFGFDIGRKKLPLQHDSMVDQLKIFCQYCGRFWNGMQWGRTVTREIISPAWKNSYDKYKIKKPSLSLY